MQRDQLKLMERRKKESLKLKQRHKKELTSIRKVLTGISQNQKNFLRRYRSKAHVATSLQVDNAIHNINYGKRCIILGLRNLHSAERVALLIKYRDNGIF